MALTSLAGKMGMILLGLWLILTGLLPLLNLKLSSTVTTGLAVLGIAADINSAATLSWLELEENCRREQACYYKVAIRREARTYWGCAPASVAGYSGKQARRRCDQVDSS